MKQFSCVGRTTGLVAVSMMLSSCRPPIYSSPVTEEGLVEPVGGEECK